MFTHLKVTTAENHSEEIRLERCGKDEVIKKDMRRTGLR